MLVFRCFFFRIVLISLLPAIFPAGVFAQERCGTVEYTESLKSKHQLFENNDHFEQWIKRKQKEKADRSTGNRTQASFQIPVVVHVIHNGEAIGTGKNISDAQVLSQIAVLNRDYERLNTDAANTPAEFQPVAGALDVEFVLAKQDPEGLATTGIVRVQGTKTSWTMNDNYDLKALSYWPAEDYLNLWVCNLTDYLGYSQFPVSALPGLENSSTNRLTDGVVITATAFGSADDGAFPLQPAYNKGRTATHEIGHFFGLRHIWGDDNGTCTGSDYVDDTPNQAGSSSGCPSHPKVSCTDIVSMFQNYLDYTDDNCMNLFTKGQAGRMLTVIQNSPRRSTLPGSHGLDNPLPVVNNLGVREVLAPSSGQCSTPFAPTAEIRNYGSNVITSSRVRVRKDGVVVETKDFTFNPAIALNASQNISFADISLSPGNHNVTFEILLTNGVADATTSNNTLGQDVFSPYAIGIPINEPFNTLPATWSIVNPDQNITWSLVTVPASGTNHALKMGFYSYEDHVGEIDMIVTPAFDLTTAPAALLKFEVAYSRFQASNDGLKVIVLSNCNTDIAQGTVVYDKTGSVLSTTQSSTSDFIPENASQWRTEAIDLSSYVGQDNLQLAFVGLNDWGNNLYVDNITLTTAPIHDVTVKSLTSPGPVTCANEVAPKLRVMNSGTLITSLKVVATVNGQAVTQSITGLNFPGNTEQDLVLAGITLQEGENEIQIVLSEPNGNPDFNPDDNSLQRLIVVNKTTDNLPLREDFEATFGDQWTITNPTGEMVWEDITLKNNTSVYVNGFDNTVKGDQSWLVSPVLNFTDIIEASVYYDQSYALRKNTLDRLAVLVSRDCGISYSDTLTLRSGAGLADGRTSEESWRPDNPSDWSTRSRILTSFAGEENVRIAFVFENDHGNNFYLDNIEFYVSETPVRIDEPFSIFPNPIENTTVNMTFHLPEKSDVALDIMDTMGKTLYSENMHGILNQNYSFGLPGKASGIYTVRIRTGGKVYYEKVFFVK